MIGLRHFYYDSFRITVSFAMACPLCLITITPNVEHACSNPAPKDPFASGHGSAIDAQSRIDMANHFDEEQCRRALAWPGIQKTVKNFLARRLRAFEKAAPPASRKTP